MQSFYPRLSSSDWLKSPNSILAVMPSAKPNKSQAKLYRFDEQVYQSLKEQKFVLDLWGVEGHE